MHRKASKAILDVPADDVIFIGKVYNDFKIKITERVREYLEVRPGDDLLWIAVENGCLIRKRQISND